MIYTINPFTIPIPSLPVSFGVCTHLLISFNFLQLSTLHRTPSLHSVCDSEVKSGRITHADGIQTRMGDEEVRRSDWSGCSLEKDSADRLQLKFRLKSAHNTT